MRIRYFAAAAQAAGTNEEHLDLDELLAGTPDSDGEATLGHVLDLLSAREPIAAPVSGDLLVRRATSLGMVLQRCSFLLNGVSAQDRARVLKPTDELDVLPPFAGG